MYGSVPEPRRLPREQQQQLAIQTLQPQAASVRDWHQKFDPMATRLPALGLILR